MNSLVQNEENFIASTKALDALDKTARARLLVCSDSHGDYKILESAIKQFGPECQAFIFCGDGASDIARILEDAKNDLDLAKAIPDVMVIVRGNCDPDVYPLSNSKSLRLPQYQVLSVSGQKVLVTHGHTAGVNFGLQDLAYTMQLQGSFLAFYGHTHVARQDDLDGYKIVNPGSCSKPRCGQAPGIAIATVDKKFVDISFIKINLLNGRFKSNNITV